MSKTNALTITNLNYNTDVKTYCNILLRIFSFFFFSTTKWWATFIISMKLKELPFLHN